MPSTHRSSLSLFPLLLVGAVALGTGMVHLSRVDVERSRQPYGEPARREPSRWAAQVESTLTDAAAEIVTIRLSDRETGRPPEPGDLIVRHGVAARVIVVDEVLTRADETTAILSDRAGHLTFTTTITGPGRRAHIGIVPWEGRHLEWLTADLGGGGSARPMATEQLSAEDARFLVSIEPPKEGLHAGESAPLRLTVYDRDRRGPALLQPLTNGFATIMALDLEGGAPVHLAPDEKIAPRAGLRSSEPVTFTAQFHKPGPRRLFTTIRVNGQTHRHAFTLRVKPPRQPVKELDQFDWITTADGGRVRALNNTKCPIMGAPVGTVEAGEYADYDGWRVMVCCSNCADDFQGDPEVYLRKALASMGRVIVRH